MCWTGPALPRPTETEASPLDSARALCCNIREASQVRCRCGDGVHRASEACCNAARRAPVFPGHAGQDRSVQRPTLPEWLWETPLGSHLAHPVGHEAPREVAGQPCAADGAGGPRREPQRPLGSARQRHQVTRGLQRAAQAGARHGMAPKAPHRSAAAGRPPGPPRRLPRLTAAGPLLLLFLTCRCTMAVCCGTAAPSCGTFAARAMCWCCWRGGT